MDDRLKELIKLSDNRFDEFNFEEINFDKNKANCEPGDKVKIKWKSGVLNGLTDIGYVIALPGMAWDEGDVIIHIPNPAGGIKCNESPQWIHLYDLMANDYVEEIK